MEEKTIKDELRELKEIVSDTKKEKERVSKPFLIFLEIILLSKAF
jgi:hypothetical protein